MKLLSCALVCLLSAGDCAFAQQAAPVPAPTSLIPAPVGPTVPNTLLDGTPIKLRLTENLSSATAKTGQQVSFEATEEITINGIPVILKGAKAMATITGAATKKSMGRGGKLDVSVNSVRLVDGESAQLRAIRETKGGGHTGAMTGAMVATAIVFWPAAPLFLFVHGKEITIPEGMEVTAFVQGDMKLDMAKMTPAKTGDASLVEAAYQPAAATTASLSVESSVTGADIEIDGAFVGSTPSTVSVAPGQHTISVKKKGYTDWSRTMNVSGRSVRLTADLEAKP